MIVPIYTHDRISGRLDRLTLERGPAGLSSWHTFDPVPDSDEDHRDLFWFVCLRGGTRPSLWVELPPGAVLVENDPRRPGDLVVSSGRKRFNAHEARYLAMIQAAGFRVAPAPVAEMARP